MEVDVHDGNGRLPVGELVEVSQAGARCWYLGKVVDVKPGVRFVEYGQGLEEVMLEPFPFARNSFEASSRGKDARVRPRPPLCSSICTRNWQKGLWVDAYRDAWREGVLMEEPSTAEVQVFFPDQGEKQRFSLEKVRVSQVWNEATDVWSVKGYQKSSEWKFGGEAKQIKPQITYQRKRKRKENTDSGKPLDTVEGADERSFQAGNAITEKPVEVFESVMVERIKRLKQIIEVETVSEVKVKEEGEEHQFVDVQPSSGYSFADGQGPNGRLVEQRLDVKSPIKVELLPETDNDDVNPEPPVTTAIPVCHMNTHSEEALFIEERGYHLNGAPIKYEDESLGLSGEKSSQSSHPSETLPFFSDANLQRKPLPNRASKKKKDAKYDAPYRRDDTLKESREQAIKYLEDSGWKKGYRERQRENRISKEAYYVAPDGTSYHSLTSACNAWMQQNKDVAKAVKDAMRSYQLQIVFRRKYGSSERPSFGSETEEGPEDGTRKRRLRPSRRHEALTRDMNETPVHAKKSRLRNECRLAALLLAPSRGKLSEGAEKGAKRTTIFSWLIDLGVVTENEIVTYTNRDTQVPWKGQLTRDGVLCHCCSSVFTMPNFQVHAGNKIHRTAALLFVDDGRSIMDCQRQALQKLEEAKAQKLVAEPIVLDENDECCGLCGEGGELICCDHCPATFHLRCVLLKTLPEGDWFCPKCRCPVCNLSQFDGRDVRFCSQCERSYHLDCTNEGGIRQDPRWFCSASCHKVFLRLRGLVGISNPMDEGYSWTLLRSAEEDEDVQQADMETVAEHSSKLVLAQSVMQECFSPMIDPRRKIDVIAHILKNCSSDLRRLDFRGFYTILLEKDELISVAAIRVHGAQIAEMPLIGTRLRYRRQGMCRRLMEVIEQVLRSMDVNTLILPALPELIDTWIGAFGFQKVTPYQIVRLLELNIVSFPGTKVLQKPLAWLNLCRRIAPPLAEKPWCPGNPLHLGPDAYSPRKPSKQRPGSLVADDRTEGTPAEKAEPPGSSDDGLEDSKRAVAKTRSNRLVRPSQRVAEALASHKSFQQLESTEVTEEEQSLELDNSNELSFLKPGARTSQLINAEPPSVSACSTKEVLEASTYNDESTSEAAADPGYASKELVQLQPVVGVQTKARVFPGLLKKCGQCGTTDTPMWRKGPVNTTVSEVPAQVAAFPSDFKSL